MIRVVAAFLLYGVMLAAVVVAFLDTENRIDWIVVLLFLFPLRQVAHWLYIGSPWLIRQQKELGMPVSATKLFSEVAAGVCIYWFSLLLAAALLTGHWIESAMLGFIVFMTWEIRKASIRRRYIRAQIAEFKVADGEDAE